MFYYNATKLAILFTQIYSWTRIFSDTMLKPEWSKYNKNILAESTRVQVAVKSAIGSLNLDQLEQSLVHCDLQVKYAVC